MTRWPFKNLFVCCCAILSLLLGVKPALAGGPHYVFAHYMVCYADYGSTLAGFEEDIQDAQAAGLDGFALDVAAWSGSDAWYYQARTELLFQAAETLGTGFKLFFSVEMTNTNDIVTMIGSYVNRSNYFHYQSNAVVSTYGQNSVNWSNGVFAPLKQQGINVFFVPYFYPEPISHAMDYAAASGLLTEYSNILNGLFYFAAGTPQTITNVNTAYGQACKDAGKVFMAGYSPSYWGCNQVNRGYIESQGGEGTVTEWMNIIQTQPDWVEIVTWNDWSESTYSSPVPDPGVYFSGVVSHRRYTHAGYLELSRRFINWYKTGQAPVINQDALFYFYRTHSTNAVASNTNDLPVTVFKGDVQDVIYSTVFLTAPANLEVSSGGQVTTNSLPAGMSHVRTSFTPGPQILTVRRNGTKVLSVQGPDILSTIQVYDYFPASGFTYSATAPTGVRILPPN